MTPVSGAGAAAATDWPRREVVPSSVLGMLLFVAAEVMFFAGLISAFTIARAEAKPGIWSVPTQPLLPAAATAVNTIALLVSGVLLFVGQRRFRQNPASALAPVGGALLLGGAFVVLQGREWVGLVTLGLTLRSSSLGSYFYLIVGAHALHAAAALIGLAFAWWRLRQGTLSTGFFLGVQTFWYFVVSVWPVIYGRVYF